MSKQSPIIGMLKRYCDLLVSTGTETVPHTGKVIWTGLVKQMEYVRVCEQIQRLRAEASGWQPIETAPKDGSWVLLSGGRQSDPTWYDQGDVTWPSAAVCRWCDEFESWKMGVVWDGDLRSNYDDPTHWIPLPAPPAVNQSLTTEVKR